MTCRVAGNETERQQVYRLRYACYRRSGAIPARDDEQFSDSFDAAPNQFSFLARDGAEAMATVRVSVVRPDLEWLEAPSRHVFGDHPAYLEIARGAFVRLVANLAAMAERFEADWLVACPRVEHCHAYVRLFGFRALAEPRRYFGVNFETRLLGIRTEELRCAVEGRRVIVAAWQEASRGLSRAAAASA
jgi:hypothetical protein